MKNAGQLLNELHDDGKIVNSLVHDATINVP